MKRLGHALLGISLLALQLSLAGRASAADGEQSAPPPDADAAATASFDRALAAYRSGDLPGALDRMQEAHRLSGKHELLYNIASLQRELGQCRAASSSYRAYLANVPQARHRAEAETALTELTAQCPEPAPSAARPAPLPPPQRLVLPAPDAARSASYWNAPRIVAWSALAVGVASAVGATYFTFAAKAARDDVQASVDRQVQGGPHWDEQRQSDQHRDQTWAQVLGVGAGALISGGVVLLVLSAHHGEGSAAQPSAKAGIWFQPGGAELGYAQAF